MGLFLVFASWGLQVGWGTAHTGSFATAADNPGFTIAHRVWGQRLGSRADRACELGDRGADFVDERRDPDVVPDGPRGRAA